MAIIMRNGLEADFDPNKMRAGELAIVTDARELHATFAPGDSPKVLLDGEAVPNPETAGIEGQVLALDENGDPEWKSVAAPSDAQVEAAVTDWLDEHPEATTTVEDGAITYAKLDSNLKGTVDDVGELKSDFLDVITRRNWYDPNDSYSVVNSDATQSRTGAVINQDGSITYTSSNGSHGQVQFKSNDETKILTPGTYTISARVTLHESVTNTDRRIYLRLGLTNSNTTVNMKTERGGAINTTEKVGWVNATFTISQDDVFTFEIQPASGEICSSNKPTIIDYVLINEGADIADYTQNLYTANDSVARSISAGAKITADMVKNVHIIGINGGYPYIKDVKKIVFNYGSTNVYVILPDGTQKTVSFSDIVTQIPNYATLDGQVLTISMPSIGVFGYDVKNDCFVVLTNYSVPYYVKPLLYRYYTIAYGELTAMSRISMENLATSVKNIYRTIYTTFTARHSWESGSNGGIIFHVGGKLNSRILGQNGYNGGALEWNDISTNISSKIVIGEGTADITIANNESLVFNTVENQLYLRNMTTNSSNINEINLVATSWGIPVSGILYDEYVNRLVEDMSANQVGSAEILSRTFNAAYHTGATSFAEKCEEFSGLLLGDTINDVTAPTDFEAFLFFTDPHLLENSGWEPQCYEFISQIQKYYNSTPTTFCLCGGDWLGNSDLPEAACYKMGYIDGFMHSMFDNCYMLVGNHDTNYQGKKDASSEKYTTRLSNQSIVNLWYREGKKAYYTFDGANTRFYCFDTGTEQQALTSYGNYGYEQATWFANALLTDNSPHIAIAAHIVYWQYNAESLSTGIQPLTEQILQIAKAYNDRSSITVNGVSYNYTSATGKVEFLIGGHCHRDYDGVLYGIPWVISANVRTDTTKGATFDLVLADYDANELKLIRVGNGENRTISLEVEES